MPQGAMDGGATMSMEGRYAARRSRGGRFGDAHDGAQGDSIFETFTLRPPSHVADEIWRMAFRNPRRGETLDFGFDDMAAAA